MQNSATWTEVLTARCLVEVLTGRGRSTIILWVETIEVDRYGNQWLLSRAATVDKRAAPRLLQLLLTHGAHRIREVVTC